AVPLPDAAAPPVASNKTNGRDGPPQGCARPKCATAASRPPSVFNVTVLLLHLREHVARGENEILLAVDLDLGAAVLGVDDLVADCDVHGDALALFEPPGAHGNDLTLLRLLLGGVRDDDPARCLLLCFFERPDDDPVLERLQAERLRHRCTPP